MNDAEFIEDAARLLALTTGLDAGVHRCSCGRIHKMGFTDEFRQVAERMKKHLASLPRPVAVRSEDGKMDFTLVEVD